MVSKKPRKQKRYVVVFINEMDSTVMGCHITKTLKQAKCVVYDYVVDHWGDDDGDGGGKPTFDWWAKQRRQFIIDQYFDAGHGDSYSIEEVSSIYI